MRLFSLLALAAVAASTFASHEADASVSIAVGFDALVKDADAVAVVTPTESKSVWEEGRIYTYTKVKVDKAIAGDTGTGETWIRTMGGVVEHVGQLVDGEAVLTAGKPNVLFIHKWRTSSTWEVSARAQGQYPVVADEKQPKVMKLIRAGHTGVLLPPKQAPEANGTTTVPTATTGQEIAKVRLAGDVLNDRPLDDATKEIATSWKTLHPAPSTK